jgi:hypothetical protein
MSDISDALSPLMGLFDSEEEGSKKKGAPPSPDAFAVPTPQPSAPEPPPPAPITKKVAGPPPPPSFTPLQAEMEAKHPGLRKELADMEAEGGMKMGAMLSPGISTGAAAILKNAPVDIARWGRAGLQAGDWVSTAGKNLPSYLSTMKWIPGATQAPYAAGQAFTVPSQALAPVEGTGLDWLHTLLGHARYTP